MQVRDLQQSSQQMRTRQVVGGNKKERSKEEAGGCQATSTAWLCQEHRMELEWQRLHLAFADDKIYKLGRVRIWHFPQALLFFWRRKRGILPWKFSNSAREMLR